MRSETILDAYVSALYETYQDEENEYSVLKCRQAHKFRAYLLRRLALSDAVEAMQPGSVLKRDAIGTWYFHQPQTVGGYGTTPAEALGIAQSSQGEGKGEA